MTKFRVIETKQKIKEATATQKKPPLGKEKLKLAGSAALTGLNTLATIAQSFGVDTRFISTMKNIVTDIYQDWSKWKKKKDALKKTNEEGLLLYLGKDKNGQNLVRKYTFGVETGKENCLFGLIENAKTPRGINITPQVFLMNADGSAIDGNAFIQNVNPITRIANYKQVFDNLTHSFHFESDQIATLVEKTVKMGIEQSTHAGLLNLGGVQKKIQDWASSGGNDWNAYEKILNEFMNNFI